FARDAVAVTQTKQAAFERDQLLVDVVELLDQRIDAGLVQAQRLHLDDDLVLQLLVLALLRGRERLALKLVRNVLLLQAAQLLVFGSNLVESFDHLRLQLGLDGGERHLVFELVVVHVAFGGGLGRILFLGVATGCSRRRGTERRRRRRSGGRCYMRGSSLAVGGLAVGGGAGGHRRVHGVS